MIQKFCLSPCILYLASCILFCSQTSAENNVRVSILSLLKPQHIKLTLEAPGVGMVKGGGSEQPWLAGRTLDIQSINGQIKSTAAITSPHLQITCSTPCQIRIEVPNKMARVYNGNLDIYYYNSTISIVISTDLENLISSIAASEMREVQDTEAIKAFAVVIRSFLMQGNRHLEREADFCDTTHCQVFQNLDAGPDIREAVHQTESLVLSYHDHMFRPYYSRACGGTTATYEQAWGRSSGGYDFPSVSCPCSNVDSRWKTSLSAAELSLISGLKAPNIFRSENEIVISTPDRKMSYSVEGFRSRVGRVFGWKRLPGSRYQIKSTSFGYEFEGTGLGHGVGFCQTGAEILAKKGASFTEILSHYFPATEVKVRNERKIITTKITK